MDDKEFLIDYLTKYKQSIFECDVSDKIIEMKNSLLRASVSGKKVIIAGNGGSAAIASHVAVDFTKQAKIRTINFNEYDLITCFANDYGYKNWLSQALKFYGDSGDVLILISSSGNSENILRAADVSKEMNISLITFTGFSSDNNLKSKGNLNFWVDSQAYNIVENTHQIWLLAVCDLIIGKAEYSA